MSELPSGTVTFLFTDIEGSTRLLAELGAERYADELGEHRRVLRDAFFVAFPTAPGALEAARDAQAALSIPVRMGLHTGTPLLTDEGYVGTDVHRAARIAAAGHGRQVLVSAATAALVDDELRDLGEHRLKDLSAPERLWQLGDGEFPRLKTLYRTNLPVVAGELVGRERELDEAGALIRSHRVVTLTGPGGSGKTRLSVHLAANAAEREEWGKQGQAQIIAIVKQMHLQEAMADLKKHDEFTNTVLVPKFGKILPGGSAYTYLPASVRRFPDPDELVELLLGVGFSDVRFRLFAGGIVALHTGVAA